MLSLCREVSEADYNLLLEGQRASVVIEGVTHYFAFVADEDYLTEYGRFLYMHAIYSTRRYAVTFKRDIQILQCSLLTCSAAGVRSADWLAPANIDDYGILLYSNKRAAIAVDSSRSVVCLPVLVELR